MPSNGGSADSAGGDRGDGGDSSGGQTGSGGGGGGGSGGGLGGGSSISGGMNPDARDDPSRKGIDGMGQGLSGTSGGLSNRSVRDSLSLGLAQLAADPMGYASHLAKENGWGITGGLAGFALGGVPGALAGKKIGSIADDFGKLSNAAISSRALGGLSAFGPPTTQALAGIVSHAIDPDTKMSSHLAGLVGAGLGGAKLGGKHGAMAGASLGQLAGSLAPAGDMNPRNSDLNSGTISSPGAVSNDGGLDGMGQGPGQQVALGGMTNAVSDRMSRAENIRRGNQWIDYQKRFHAA